jgi:hypothetical protein
MPGYEHRSDTSRTQASSSSSSQSSYRPTDSGPTSQPTLDEDRTQVDAGDVWGDAAYSSADHFDWYDDPARIDEDLNMRFGDLPLSGAAEKRPWSGDYWAKNKGGIGYRWKTDESHDYTSPTAEEVKTWTPEQIDVLSPAEKYDLYLGEYDMPLAENAKANNVEGTASWQGYCHGWTQAATHFEEPEPVVMTNPDGLQIPFSSADIKALLTFLQGETVQTQLNEEQHPYKQDTRAIGANNGGLDARYAGASDVNPGAFHALLGNKMGVDGDSFGIDADNGTQKWNHPLEAYQSQVVMERAPVQGANPAAVREVVLRTDVTYTLEIHPQHESTQTTGNHSNKTEQYLYSVELNETGHIVGGQWLLESDGNFFTYDEVVDYFEQERGMSRAEVAATMPQVMRFPDYAWVQDQAQFAEEQYRPSSVYEFISNPKPKLHGYMTGLKDIMDASLGG